MPCSWAQQFFRQPFPALPRPRKRLRLLPPNNLLTLRLPIWPMAAKVMVGAGGAVATARAVMAMVTAKAVVVVVTAKVVADRVAG